MEEQVSSRDLEMLKEEKKLEKELSDDAKESIRRAREQPPAGRTLEIIRERV